MNWEAYFTQPPVATEYRGDYFFLSNMMRLETHALTPYGRLPTLEHVYLFYKSDQEWWKEFVASRDNPFTVKKASSKKNEKFILSKHWDDGFRLKLMSKLIDYKFDPKKNPKLSAQLKALHNHILIEGNKHHDVFFGVFEPTKEGKNYLGLLHMRKARQLNDGVGRLTELLTNPEIAALVDELPKLGEL